MKRKYEYRLQDPIVLPPKSDVVFTETFEQGDVESFEVKGFSLIDEAKVKSPDDVAIYDIRIDGRSLLRLEAQRQTMRYHLHASSAPTTCSPRTLRHQGKVEIWLVSMAGLKGPTLRLSLTLRGMANFRSN